MKKHFHILVTLLACAIVAGCSSGQGDRLFRWSSVGSDADSTITRLEWAFINNRPNHVIDDLASRLDSISKNDSDRLSGARACFWRGRLLIKQAKYDDARWHLDRALEMLDSSAYPYDAQRISHLKALLPSTGASEKYTRLKNAEKFYRKTGDDYMLAHVLGDLGIMSERLGGLRNPSEVLKYYQETDSLYGKIGFNEYQTKNMINVAQGYLHVGDSAKCREIISTLLHHPLAINDSGYYDLVLLSAGGWFDDINLLKQLYYRDHAANKRLAIEAAILLYDHYVADPDSAAPYIDFAYANIDHAINEGSRAAILERYGMRLGKAGLADSAYNVLSQALNLQREYMEKNNVLDVARIGKVYEIEKIEAAHNEAIKRRSQWYWIGFALLIALGTIIASRLIVGRQKERLQTLILQQETERKSRRLAATSLIMEEKDKVLQTLIDDLHQLGKDGKLSAAEVRLLEQNFRVHMSGKTEWEGFANSFEEVHPGFYTTMRERYPNVSEGDLKMAAYIKMGMGQKQIARMMGVQPESAKKNRHRLRSRMGLSESDSLEDILRNIGS